MSASKGKETPAYSVHLDLVRGAAALTVFLSHIPQLFFRPDLHKMLAHAAGSASQATRANLNVPRPQIGHEVVVVFFVLSGFFVGGSALRGMAEGMWTWKDYLLRRFTRLWVVLIPALALTWLLDGLGTHLFSGIASIYTGPAGQYEVLPNLAAYLTPTVLLGNLLFLQGILVPTFGTNEPLWSLSYEFWYYIAFPFLAIALAAKSPAPRRWLSFCALAVLLACCGALISSYFLIWLMGVAVYRLPLGLRTWQLRWAIPATTLLLLLTIVVAVGRSWPLFATDVTIGVIFSTLLWLLLHYRRPAPRTLYRTVASGMSNMSYTLYAVHLPILVFLNACIMRSWKPWPMTPWALCVTTGIFVFTFFVAYGVYRCFEANTDQVRHFLTRRFRLSRKPIVVAVSSEHA
jgi:peptidoglycan/LPS O-acetylase OafA/YrhL